MKPPSPRERFLLFFEGKFIKNSNGCFVWSGYKNDKGYGQTYYDNRRYGAHRLAYELEKGPILKDLLVCHSCDNPPCINPDHLWLGTHHENMVDMMKKNRGSISKLSEENKQDIKFCYSGGLPIEDISVMFNTPKRVVDFIVN